MLKSTQPKQDRKKQGRHPERVLSAGFVRTVTQPGRYLEGLGLSLLVTKTGGRCWILRLTINGRVRELGLGGYPLTSLAQAREKALANKRLVREGGDPLERFTIVCIRLATRVIHIGAGERNATTSLLPHSGYT